MGINIIISWPRNTDYPLWRQFIRDNRNRFQKVIVVFTETNYGKNYREFIIDAMHDDNVDFMESPPPINDDWRNVAVNYALTALPYKEDQWVWFTEQDFFPLEGFWEEVYKNAELKDVGAIGIIDGIRLHPACIFMKREILDKTRKAFGIRPDVADHFYMVQEDLQRLAETEGIRTKILDQNLYKHMAGLSHNMRLIEEGGQPNHQKEEFINYLKKCVKVSVPLEGFFTDLSNRVIQENQNENESPSL